MTDPARGGARPATFDAFHLPAVDHPSVTTWSYGRGAGAFEVRVPRLTAAQLRRQVEALVAARDAYLARRPVARVVEVIDAVAARLLDPVDPLRRAAEHTLPAVTGYSPAMIRLVLDRMAADWRSAPLRELLRAEFGDPRVLDGFVPSPRRDGLRAAYGPRLATHVFSGNVPGVAVTSIVRSLLVKAATLGKTAVGEPLLAAFFARGLAEADPELGACLAVTYWAGGDEEMERAALEGADVVVVYGGADAVAAVRARTPPTARLLAYGPRVSFGVVAGAALGGEGARETAARAALDASTFDQQGCVSPHLFYVEEGGAVSPAAWARMLAEEMAAVEAALPRGTLAPGESSAIRQLRAEAEFTEAGGGGLALHASAEGTAWTVVYDPEPAFAASCLNRVVRVKPLAGLGEVARLAAPFGAVLQSVGVGGPADALRAVAAVVGPLGASRVAPLGEMAWPPPHWQHDGRPPLGDLVRWCEMESPAP
jgi:hypothetical protein